MAPLLFICPKTSQQAPTGIKTDVRGLSASWRAMLKVHCPHCGEVHEISVRDSRHIRLKKAARARPA